MTTTLLCGDAVEVLRTLPAATVNCVITSPPYHSTRDYNVDGQIGTGQTVAEYVAALVAVFSEVGRVLRPDGVLWVNIGDHHHNKNLLGIPWRFAFAMQDAGWILRTSVIWQKKNPMGSSVRDAPTSCHEDLFFFTKQQRYFYDGDRIREPATATVSATKPPKFGGTKYPGQAGGSPYSGNPYVSTGTRNKRDVWTTATAQSTWGYCRGCRTLVPRMAAIEKVGLTRICPNCGATDRWVSHFAPFPEALIEPCILASTPTEICLNCDRPVVHRIEKGAPLTAWQQQCGSDGAGEYHGTAHADYASGRAQDPSEVKRRILAGMRERIRVREACNCDAGFRPGVVLDPFIGSGTTAITAERFGLDCVGIDLSPIYIEVAEARLRHARAGAIR